MRGEVLVAEGPAVDHETDVDRPVRDAVALGGLAFAQAALGAVINVGLLEGGTTELKIAPGTQHGEIMRVPGLGAPLLRSPERRGDLVIILQLVVPRKLDETQRELLNQFAETESLEVDHKSPGFWSRIKDTFSELQATLNGVRPFDGVDFDDAYLAEAVRDCEGNHLSFPIPPIELLEHMLQHPEKR